MSALCRIEMLGGLCAHVGGRTIARFQTQKTGALLAYLAVHPGKLHPREALAEMLWPGNDPTAIRNRLNQAVSSLRRQLHPPGVEPGSVLQANNQTISLNAKTVESDVDEFRRAMPAVLEGEVPEMHVARLEHAVRLYRGEFLSGFYEDWVLSERLFLHEQYIEALDRLIKSFVESGMPERAIELASRRLEADPLDESGHVRLMRLYLRLDRPRATLRQYESLARLLEAEGDEPGESATRLAAKAKLLAADSADEMEVWQEPDSSVLVGSVRELARIDVPWSSAPRFFTRFVGRDSELNRMEEWLLLGDALATIVGVGGCGKTRLAAQFVIGIEGKHRVVWTSLAHIVDARQITAEVVAAAGGDRHSAWDPEVQLRALFEGEATPLIVLDNLEHLVDLPDFDLRPLLSLHERIRIIATSRRAIGLDGELVMSLSPLPVPRFESSMTLQELATNASIDLFINRAQLVKQDFQLTERTAEAISNLCQRLEGLPLAIELAASWARSLSPNQMLDELTQRLDFLATRRRDISERHRSMRAAIDSSFNLLPDPLKEFFVRLSVFHGGFTHDSARAVAPEIEPSEALDELVSRSLIVAADDEGRTRFSMLELLRAYARSKASADLLSEIEWLHAIHFLEFVRLSESLRNGVGATAVDSEIANILAALDFFIRAEGFDQALRMAELMGGYFEYRDRVADGLHWLCKVEALARECDPLTLAKLRRRIALLSWVDGDFDRAHEVLSLSIPILREFEASGDLIDALLLLRLEAHRTKHFEEAMVIADELLELASRLNDERNVAHILRHRGNSMIELGQIDQGVDGYRQSLEIGRKIGCSDAIGFALLNMGFMAIRMGRFDAAKEWLDEAEEVLTRSGRIAQLFDVVICKLKLSTELGTGQKSYELVRRLASWEIEGWAYHWESFSTMGQFLISEGEYESATRLLGFAQTVVDRVHGGASQLLLNEFDAAVANCRQALGQEFEEPFSIGRSMTLGQARRCALEVRSTILA